jgi:hypothetical protein
MNTQKIFSAAVNGNYFFAGSGGNGVYISTNTGASWYQSPLNNGSVYSLLAENNIIFAGAESGIYFSANNGTNWIHTILNNRIVYSLASGENILFAGTGSNGIYRSADNGISWNQSGLSTRTVYALTSAGNNLFAGTDSHGVYISADKGITWNETALKNVTVLSLAVSSGYILAGTKDSGIFASSNNGISWERFNAGFSAVPTVYAMLITNGNLLAGTKDYAVWRRNISEIEIINISSEIPERFQLFQNYPNPFNPVTKIKFSIPAPSSLERVGVRLLIYDALGRQVATLVNEKLQPGTYEVEFDGSKYASGIYYYRFSSGDPSLSPGKGYSITKKMVLIK